MAIEVLQIGGKCPAVAGREEGVIMTFDNTGITLYFNYNRPTAGEIAGFKADTSAEFRYIVMHGLFFMLVKLEGNQWCDAPYAPQLGFNVDLVEIGETQGIATQLVLVDRITNTVKGLRAVGLGHNFSVALRNDLVEIGQTGLIKPVYDSQLKQIYQAYSTTEMVKLASHRYKLR